MERGHVRGAVDADTSPARSAASSTGPAPAPLRRQAMIQILRRDQPAPPSCFGQAGKVVPADAQSGQDHHFSRRDMPLTDPPADKAFLPAESCALCTVEGGQPVDGGSDRGDDGSPRSVALTAWQAPIPSQACVLSTGSQPRDQTMWTLSHGSANGDEARSRNMIDHVL